MQEREETLVNKVMEMLRTYQDFTNASQAAIRDGRRYPLARLP